MINLIASSTSSSVRPGHLERRSATVTRGESDLSTGVGQRSENSTVFSRQRSFSQSSDDPDPDLEKGEIRPRDEDSPAYADTLETIKNG